MALKYKISNLFDMSGQCSFSIDSKISQNQTIIPRLDYSITLIYQVIDSLQNKRIELKNTNQKHADYEEHDECLKTIETERTVSIGIETLLCVLKKINSVNRMDTIPKLFPSFVPVIRTLSAQLMDVSPEASQQLSELSVHLGSIVLDSATLTKAQFDFNQSNRESAILLDEVKLMVDSKINKQYAHLDFFQVPGN